MEKHRYNIFPEMLDEDYKRLKGDILSNGFDTSQPIITYESEILDGWNRQKVCNELGVTPAYKEFTGDSFDAIQFVMRTNKRRNLTSSQWAAIAADADELWDVIQKEVEAERRKKQSENAVNRFTNDVASGNKFPQPKPERTRQKIAEQFNTNDRYVSDAKKYKDSDPEYFEAIKSGTKSIPEIKKEDQTRKRVDKIQNAEISERDRKLIEQLDKGRTIVVNQHTDLATVRHAENKGLFMRCDRFSDWGNPYEMGKDGTRDQVCDNYRDHYIQFKPSLKNKVHTLKGKALACWCAPQRCHCEILKELSDE